MGRPKLGDRIEYRIPEEDRDVIKRIAEEKGLSESEVVRRLIKWSIRKLELRSNRSQ